MREIYAVKSEHLDAEVVFELDFDLIPHWKGTVRLLDRSSLRLPTSEDEKLAYAKYVGRELIHDIVRGLSGNAATFNLWDNPVFSLNPEAVIVKAKTVGDSKRIGDLEVTRL